jgi:hypothetical protein
MKIKDVLATDLREILVENKTPKPSQEKTNLAEGDLNAINAKIAEPQREPSPKEREKAFSASLEKGMKVEKEHHRTYALIQQYLAEGKMIPEDIFYASIARDHIGEHSDYYDKLATLGL